MFYRIPTEFLYSVQMFNNKELYRNKDKCVEYEECEKDDYNKKDPIGIYALIDEEYICYVVK